MATASEPESVRTTKRHADGGGGDDEGPARAIGRRGAVRKAGREDAADAERGQEVPVAGGAKAQALADEDEEDSEGAVDRARDDVGAHERKRIGLLAQRAPADREIGADRGVDLLDGDGRAAQRLAGERGDDGGADQERDAVDGEHHGGRAEQQKRGAEGRSGDDAQAGDADARGVRGRQVSGADEPRHDGHDALRVGGARGGAHRGEQRGEDGRRAREGDDRERAHGGGAQDVGGDHDQATVVAVGEHAADRPQRDLGQDARRGGDPDPGRGPRALIDEGEEGQVVEPVAGLGGDQAAEQDAKVALTQRDEKRAGGIQHAITGVVGGTQAAEPGWLRGRAGRSVVALADLHFGLLGVAVGTVGSMRLRPPGAHRAADRSSGRGAA